MRRFALVCGVLIVALIMSGCGDTYRPVVVPNPPPIPDPRAAHNLFVISNNGSANKGTGMQVNVSGDSNMGVIPLGIAPVHASLTANGSRVLSANFLNDTVSVIAPASTLGGITKVADVVFPTGFGPRLSPPRRHRRFMLREREVRRHWHSSAEQATPCSTSSRCRVLWAQRCPWLKPQMR